MVFRSALAFLEAGSEDKIVVLLVYLLAIVAAALAPYILCLFMFRVFRKMGVGMPATLAVIWPCGFLGSYLILQRSFEVMREAWFFWMFVGLPIQAGGVLGMLLLPVLD